MRAFILALLLMSSAVKAANIYVIDGGILPAYRPQLAGKLLEETCFSVGPDDRRPRQADPLNTTVGVFYQYRQVSLCQNRSARQQAAGATILRTQNLPENLRANELIGAIGRGGNPDVPVPVFTDSHHSVVADVIKSNTTPGVKQWHAVQEFILGINAFGEKDYVNSLLSR